MPLLNNLHDYLSRKECPYTQFAKYMVCGGASIVVDVTVFYLLAWLALPCLKPGDPFVKIIELLGFSIRTVEPTVLLRNFWTIKFVCFTVANITVYILNILYVFERGRHRPHHEILLFFSISLTVFLLGTWAGALLIGQADWHITYTYAFILTCSVAANYVLRKFVVFKR
jgi:putative flippase GtrA